MPVPSRLKATVSGGKRGAGKALQAQCFHLHCICTAPNQDFQKYGVKRCMRVHTQPIHRGFPGPQGLVQAVPSSPAGRQLMLRVVLQHAAAQPRPGLPRAEQSRAPCALTLAVLLVRPVPAVVLLIALPPVGDAVPVPALELVVPGAVRGLCRVF